MLDAPTPWTWLHQVHGAAVVVVDGSGLQAGASADAAVTSTPGCAVAVRTADCAPLVLLGSRSVGVVHAGWRGLMAGVVAAAVDALRALGDDVVSAHLGPCIRPGCYEFAGAERESVLARFGDIEAVATATTMWGTPALDVPAMVGAALAEVGVTALQDIAGCTACDRRWYSHRARGEPERFATVAWVPAP